MKNRTIYIKKLTAFLSQVFFVILILIGTTLIFHNVYYTPVQIVGSSMEPTLFNHEFGIMDTHEPALNTLSRFDIIVVKQSPSIDRYIIKRVIGLPNESMVLTSNGDLLVEQEKIDQPFLDELTKEQTCLNPNAIGCATTLNLGENEYFLLGDNRDGSLDSRVLGTFYRDQFVGKLIAIEGVCVSSNLVELDDNNCPSRTYRLPRFYL
jgi:signal peptidase I